MSATIGTQIVKAQSSVLAADTIGNTTTATATGTSWTMPANFLSVGRAVRVTARGYYSTLAALPGNLTLDLMGGTWVLATTGAQAVTAGLANDGWKLEADLICGVTGAGGSVLSQGMALLQTAGLVANLEFMTNIAGVSIDTTVAQQIRPRVTFTVAGNTITMGTFICEIGGAQ